MFARCVMTARIANNSALSELQYLESPSTGENEENSSLPFSFDGIYAMEPFTPVNANPSVAATRDPLLYALLILLGLFVLYAMCFRKKSYLWNVSQPGFSLSVPETLACISCVL